jgi:hypothetical protein
MNGGEVGDGMSTKLQAASDDEQLNIASSKMNSTWTSSRVKSREIKI